jgi:malyl-CoA/(S)-citramalyl-CoA lyase
MASARSFYQPLALGAPAPLREQPAELTRMLHFFDPSNPRMIDKLPELARQADVLVANLEDGVPADRKTAARDGLTRLLADLHIGPAQLWVRINALDTAWALDDLLALGPRAADGLSAIMVPKVTGPADIHFVDRILAQLEAKAAAPEPMRVHAVLETAGGVSNVEAICAASPRMQGLSLGPADLAADRRMKTSRVGGGDPGYVVRTDTCPEGPARTAHWQDPWHYTIVRMVDACVQNGITPYYGPFGDLSDPEGCEAQFRSAYVLGCAGAWSLHPSQIEIARRVFSPDPAEIAWAERVLRAIPDETGSVVIDGKMQDEASVKQCRLVLDLAAQLRARGAPA